MTKTHRKRRSTWIDITFSFTIIGLTVAAIYLFSLGNKNNAAASPPKTQAANPDSVLIDTIDSNYPGIKIITETSNDTYSPFAIQYPQSLHNTFNDAISTYISKAKQNYLIEMEKNSELASHYKGELNISFETLSHHSGNYSFVIVNNSSTGGANGSTEVRSFHLNPETGKIISIEDVFGSDLEQLETVATLVRGHLYNDVALKNYLFPEELHINTEPIWSNYSNFALTDDSIIFYFDEYELAAGAVGPPVVAIALHDINDLLADEFKLKVEIPNQEQDEDQVIENPNDNVTPEQPIDKEESDSIEQDSEGTTIPDAPEDADVKKVALTFDDGPDPKVTMQILETLEKFDAKATFFMLGSRVEYYPDIAKNVKDAGHELGNHTWNHPDLTKAEVEKVRNEINRTSSIIETVTGTKATAFRPPYGAINQTVRSQTNLPVVLWDVDTLDWKHRDPNQLLANVKEKTKDGSIILMHDIHQATADGLDAILAYLQSEGYVFVTVSEME
ncbi:polysaccharide deacetylase family protein [Sporosarcina sp. YIM B06819]|uniref:polysaccharide deacetylase family protein n=1 Tax=Sporosarcina sp. YIM B06819 TaxID=3081769 RepID=UPI00298C4B53|nr:polysaccharide deacetylase family protein [Sporosarcina sp. YIM B06819]